MSTQDFAGQESAGTTEANRTRPTRRQTAAANDAPDEVPRGALHLGVDGAGADHYFRAAMQTVWVVESGAVTEKVNLSAPEHEGLDLGDWIDYVASERGAWTSHCVIRDEDEEGDC